MRLSTFMTREPVTIGLDAELSLAVDLMDEHDVRHLPVVEGDALVGVLSDRDLLAATGWRSSRLARKPGEASGYVRDLLRPHAVVASPDEPISSAARRMIEQRVRSLPVVDGGRLVGLVTDYDVQVEYVSACRERRLSDRDDPTVSECMTRELETVSRKTSIADAFSRLHRADVLHLPVVDDGRLGGIVSDRDFRLHVGRGGSTHLPVDAIAAKEVIVIDPEGRLSNAADLLVMHKIGAVPVARDGALLGLLSSSDVLAVCATARWPEERAATS